ncbi:MAG: 50S ribosomal protein L9 [Alphaproteobacteria bacterium]
MEIILLERVENLGQMGDVISVKNGYARNFLLPRKKALRATEANKKIFEAQKAQLEAENLKKRDEAQKVADSMGKLEVILIRQAGEMGQLYGSVNARDIADAAKEAGVTIARQQVSLLHPIKSLGLFDVNIVLHPEVIAVVEVNVARSEDEAAIQHKTGAAVVARDDDEDEAIIEEAPAKVEAEAETIVAEAEEVATEVEEEAKQD